MIEINVKKKKNLGHVGWVIFTVNLLDLQRPRKHTSGISVRHSQGSLTEEGGSSLNVDGTIPQAGVLD